MPDFCPQILAHWSSGRWFNAPPDRVSGFVFDSRKAGPGDLFVCLKTESRDGHEFMGMAREKGAVAALVSQPDPSVELPQLVVADPLAALQEMARRHRQQLQGPMVGITGSCGKTSTKELLALLLDGIGGADASRGNFNNHIGVPMTLLGMEPSSFRRGVVEAGINLPGEMERLARMIAPTDAIVTLVAAVHLEKLKDLDGVAREKSILARAVPPEGSIAVPASCLAYPAFRELSGRLMVAAREAEPVEAPEGAEIFRFSVRQEAERTAIEIRRPGGGVQADAFSLPKVSDGMAQNAVLAILMAWRLGCSSEGIAERLAAWQPARLRGEWRRLPNVTVYVDCYNANPAALEDSARFFAERAKPDQPRLYLLGCMGELGEESPRLHRESGRRLPLRAGDRICLIGPEAQAFAEGIRECEGAPPRENIRVCDSMEGMAAELKGFSGYVFLKGSRVYAMEQLLDQLRDGAPAGKEVAC